MCQSRDLIFRRRPFRAILFLIVLGGLWGVFSTPAWAHKVVIFAWVEGDTVYTRSKFPNGKRVKNGTVVVYDKEGRQLLEGKTDENGEFSFKVPKETDLRVVLKASMGHQAEWTIMTDDIGDAAGGSGTSRGGLPIEPPHEEDTDRSHARVGGEQYDVTTVSLSREEIQAMINQSLDKKLTPVLDMLADSVDQGPSMRDVIAGIGYIFGLVGVALYFSNRRKKG